MVIVAPPDPWPSLEIAKLIIGVLTPLTVAVLGWYLSRHLKRFELLQWSNQKLIEKRLALYDSIAPQLNKLLCFYTWVGYWKAVSPEDVLAAKRELDQCLNIYRHLFDESVYESYQVFMHTLFRTFQGAGEDAKIRSLILGPDGDRAKHCLYVWKDAWGDRFVDAAEVAPHSEVRKQYYAVMNALRESLGGKS